MTTVTDSNAIAALRLRTAIRAIELEAKGMRRRGQSVTNVYRRFYGMRTGASREQIIARMKEDLAAFDAAFLKAAEGEAVE